MITHSRQFHSLARQIAKRRRDLLRNNTHSLFYPPAGTAWTPSDQEAAFYEAFIVLVVAELETYFEWVIEASLEMFEKSFLASGAGECGGASVFVEKIREKQRILAKNNNANWSRLSELFEFVGLRKDSFPGDFWDDVEHLVKERGGIAHKSLGLRAVSDPRQTLSKSEAVFRKLKLFDRDFQIWLAMRSAELARLQSLSFVFTPGLGTISTAPRGEDAPLGMGAV